MNGRSHVLIPRNLKKTRPKKIRYLVKLKNYLVEIKV